MPADVISNPPGRLKRLGLSILGVFFVILAAVGVFLPILPTTGPLILASICLMKSNPRLEERLVRSKFFAPFHPYLDGNAEMPVRAKVIAISIMWICIGVSSWFMLRGDTVPEWIVALVILSGFLGSWFIWRLGRNRNAGPVTSEQ